MESTAEAKPRIQSIDVLRGLVMVIMALDHARDYFYKVDLTKAADAALDPTNLATTFPALFFTRWITHFCAPIFVFLAGTSIYIMSKKKSRSELSIFLIKRGLWLVILEVVVVTFGWTFNPFYNVIILQVIWAIGLSMIVLGLLVQLPYKVILALGVVIVAGHNLLDALSVGKSVQGNPLADVIYFASFSIYPIFQNHIVIVIYAFLPWTGVMLLGYCFGKLFEPEVSSKERVRKLVQLGWGTMCVFIVLRILNFYGDPVPWAEQPRGDFYTFLSFLNVNKYPPSLLFICMALGAGILFLAFMEKAQNRFTRVMDVYGKVPMAYYVLHFYFLHLLVIVVFFAQGFGANDIIPKNNPFFFKPDAFGFGLWGVYAMWLLVVVALYPICKKYGAYKRSHKHWWLSYL